MANITLIIPTFNERDNIVPLLERIHQALSNYNYKVLLIDDDSKDGTSEIAKSLSSKYPVEVIVRKGKRGLASAVVDGINLTTDSILGVMDADLQHPPEALPDLIEAINDGADVVIASRYVKGGGCEGWSLSRRIVSKVAVSIAHLFLPQTRRFKDPMSGFFMLGRSVVANASLEPTGYKILLEILVRGHYQHAVEVPYIFKTRSKGASKLNARQQIDYLKHILSLMKRTGELLRFIKFALVGTSGVEVNLGSYWLLTRLLHINQFIALGISFEVSVVSNFLFNNFFTFADRRVSRALPFLVQFVKFNIISLGGLGIQEGSLWLLHTILNIHDIIAVAIGIVVATLWNYLLNTWWTWK